jgi:NADP-dependent 3-hydroxy acid dehydrogenase YdfG
MAQSILIVGGGQGIGLETTKAILSQASPTARIVAFGLHADPELDSLSNAYSDRVKTVIGDVTSASDRSKAVETCVKEFGGIDTLVYTAGVITPIQRIEKVDMEAVKKAYDVNVFGTMAMVGLEMPIDMADEC